MCVYSHVLEADYSANAGTSRDVRRPVGFISSHVCVRFSLCPTSDCQNFNPLWETVRVATRSLQDGHRRDSESVGRVHPRRREWQQQQQQQQQQQVWRFYHERERKGEETGTFFSPILFSFVLPSPLMACILAREPNVLLFLTRLLLAGKRRICLLLCLFFWCRAPLPHYSRVTRKKAVLRWLLLLMRKASKETNRK